MLVLTRRESEKIIIGGDIEITLVKVEGNKVRIGINAPKDLPIHRAELLEGIAGQVVEMEATAEPVNRTRQVGSRRPGQHRLKAHLASN